MESSFGTSSDARRKRVYYTETSTIYEGMPVCYEFDATTNVLGYDKAAGGDVTCQTSPETTAEGYQNEGKFIRVEDPDANNIQYFAGVVAGSSYAGLIGPRWLDIYIPNGAIVPVRTDLNCLIGQTILAVTTASQELGVPLETDSRAVAVAEETVDRGTAGLVLARLSLDQFMYQDHGGTPLSVDDAATTGSTIVNHINIKFLGSANYQKGLYAIGEIAGAGGCAFGMWKFRTYVNAALANDAHTLCANLHLKEAARLPAQGNPEYASAPLYLSVETDGSDTPDLSAGNLAAIYVGYYVNESGGAPAKAHVLSINSTTYNWDGLLIVKNFGDIGDATVANATTQESASDKYLPIEIGGTTYYLRAFVTAQ